MPPRRVAGGTRLVPVLSDLCGALVKVATRLRERVRHRGVHAHAPFAQLRALRDLLGERVLEGVLELGIECRLVQELRRRQRRERRTERRLLGRRDARHDPAEQRLIERLADHRSGLKHLLLALWQPIDARRQDGLNAGRHLQRLNRHRQPVGAAPSRQLTAVHQRLHHLLGEERIALSPRVDDLGQPRHAWVFPELIAQERVDRLGIERLERQPLVVWALHPGRVILRAEGDDQEVAGGGQVLDGRLEISVAGAVEPVQVLEQDHVAPIVGRVVEDLLQDTVDALLPLLGVNRRRRVRRVRHAEQVEDERQHFTVTLVHQEQPVGDLRPGRLRTVVITDLVEGAPHLQHGEHRDRLAVRDTAPLEDPDPARATPLDELGAQARLAGARLANDADHLTAAAARALERFFPQLLVPVQPANTEPSTWSVYYNFDQYLWSPQGSPDKGVGLFFRFGISDGNPNPIKYAYNVGVSANGVVPGRPNDNMGVGWGRTQFSSEFLPFLRQRLNLGLNVEDAVEVYYNAVLTPWLNLAVDLQVVESALNKKLGPNDRLENMDTAVVGALRMYVRF